VFARQSARDALLVVEVKTRIVDMQDLLATLDRQRRLAPELARSDGWRPRATGSVLLLPEETWARNAVRRHDALFRAALPGRTIDVRRWLADPHGDLPAIWFLLVAPRGSAKRRTGGVQRVRSGLAASFERGASVDAGRSARSGARRAGAGPSAST
jgi:hypothetical protein